MATLNVITLNAITLRVAPSTLNVKIILCTLRVNIVHIASYCEKVLSFFLSFFSSFISLNLFSFSSFLLPFILSSFPLIFPSFLSFAFFLPVILSLEKIFIGLIPCMLRIYPKKMDSLSNLIWPDHVTWKLWYLVFWNTDMFSWHCFQDMLTEILICRIFIKQKWDVCSCFFHLCHIRHDVYLKSDLLSYTSWRTIYVIIFLYIQYTSWRMT